MIKIFVLILALLQVIKAGIPTCEDQSKCLTANITELGNCEYKICLEYSTECQCNNDICSCECDKCSCQCNTAGDAVESVTCDSISHVCCGEGGNKKIIQCSGTAQEAFCCDNTCSGITCNITRVDEICPPPDICKDDNTTETGNCDGIICCQTISGGDYAVWGIKDGNGDCCNQAGGGSAGCKSYDLGSNNESFECSGAPFGANEFNRICGDNRNAKDQNECRWKVMAPICVDCQDELICPSDCPSSAKTNDKIEDNNNYKYSDDNNYMYNDESNNIDLIIIVVISIIFGLIGIAFGLFVWFRFKNKSKSIGVLSQDNQSEDEEEIVIPTQTDHEMQGIN
eukprot:340054_1